MIKEIAMNCYKISFVDTVDTVFADEVQVTALGLYFFVGTGDKKELVAAFASWNNFQKVQQTD